MGQCISTAESDKEKQEFCDLIVHNQDKWLEYVRTQHEWNEWSDYSDRELLGYQQHLVESRSTQHNRLCLRRINRLIVDISRELRLRSIRFH
jgi:hypothetical protein